jgi:hypothetical protein
MRPTGPKCRVVYSVICTVFDGWFLLGEKVKGNQLTSWILSKTVKLSVANSL